MTQYLALTLAITILLYAGYLRQTKRRWLWFAALTLALVVLIIRYAGQLGEWQSWLNIVLDLLVGAFLADLLVEYLLGRRKAKRR